MYIMQELNTKKILDLFPDEVVQMAYKGLYTLFISQDKRILVAKDEEHVFCFSAISGEFTETISASEFQPDRYQRVHLVTPEQVQTLLKTAN